MLPTDLCRTALITGAAGVAGLAIAKALAEEGYTLLLADIAAGDLRVEMQRPRPGGPPRGSRRQPPGAGCGGGQPDPSGIRVCFGPGQQRRRAFEQQDGSHHGRGMAPDLRGEPGRRLFPCAGDRSGNEANALGPDRQRLLARHENRRTHRGNRLHGFQGGAGGVDFSLARELAPFGVTVNGVAPAYIKTPMITDFLSRRSRNGCLSKSRSEGSVNPRRWRMSCGF